MDVVCTDGLGFEDLMGVDWMVNNLGCDVENGKIGKDDGGCKGLDLKIEGEGKLVESRRKDEQKDMVDGG